MIAHHSDLNKQVTPLNLRRMRTPCSVAVDAPTASATLLSIKPPGQHVAEAAAAPRRSKRNTRRGWTHSGVTQGPPGGGGLRLAPSHCVCSLARVDAVATRATTVCHAHGHASSSPSSEGTCRRRPRRRLPCSRLPSPPRFHPNLRGSPDPRRAVKKGRADGVAVWPTA